MRGDGRIYRRGEIFFIAYSIGGREFRESTGSKDCADAQRLLAERIGDRHRALQAVRTAPTAATFDDLAGAYVADYQLREHRTLSTARARVEHLRRYFGGMLAAAITEGSSVTMGTRTSRRLTTKLSATPSGSA